MMKRLLTVALAAMLAGSAAAQRVQLGVRAGVFSQDMELTMSDIMTDAQLGWNAAFVSRIRITAVGRSSFGMGLYLQPEIVYSQNNYKMQEAAVPPSGGNPGKPAGKVTKVSMRDVDIPVLLSFQIAIVRLQAGPVFNVMHKTPTQKGNADMTSIRPTVGFGLGASVDIWGGLVLDGRYNGNFKKLKNNIQQNGFDPEDIKGSLSSWSVGLSWLF